MTERRNFVEHYGPWAVISGASDGTGAAFAEQLAAKGLNLVLIARRQEPLEALAAGLQARHGVETRIASIDLYRDGAGAEVVRAADGLEVGLYVSNAGADTNACAFLDTAMDAWSKLIQRNVVALTEAVYGFASAMRPRGRGGLILMSSGAALGGAPGVAIYSATKAFDLNLAEALWAELGPAGIDVIAGVCPPMDTPSFRRYMEKVGFTMPGAVEAETVVADLIERLPAGPIRIFPYPAYAVPADVAEARRRESVNRMVEAARMFSKG